MSENIKNNSAKYILEMPYHVRIRARERNIICGNIGKLVRYYADKVLDSEFFDEIEDSFTLRDFKKHIVVFFKIDKRRNYLRVATVGDIYDIYPREGEYTISLCENGKLKSHSWINKNKQKNLLKECV